MNECAFGAVVNRTTSAGWNAWNWIGPAFVVDAIIVVCAILIPIFIPQLRLKLPLGAAAAVFTTAVAGAFLLPHRLCVGLGGWIDVSLGARIFVAGVGLFFALILASLAVWWGSRATLDLPPH